MTLFLFKIYAYLSLTLLFLLKFKVQKKTVTQSMLNFTKPVYWWKEIRVPQPSQKLNL